MKPFGREERFHASALGLRVHADPGILDYKADTSVRSAGLEGYCTAIRHRLDRITYQTRCDLPQFGWITDDSRVL
jgi:hypothetical protein